MCGIGGAVSRSRDLESLIPLILEDQKKRGPDFQSKVHLTASNMQISLAHNRLAILDLTDESNQPFIDAETGACIVFNGEIYNYREIRSELIRLGDRFVTHGDTEVLLKAFLRWGPATFTRINGMFAFAVWVPQTQTLTMVRDRFGVKPCYYVNRLHKFAFASNTTALADFFSPNINLEYLAHGLAYNLYEDSDGASPYQEINSLPPGHFLEFNADKISIHQYYNFEVAAAEETERIKGLSEELMLTKLEERLRYAVQLRLQADVPVTISLSGGLDSALLASLTQLESRREFEAFTFGTLEDPRSEARLAQDTASRLGIKLNFVDVPDHKLPEIFESTLRVQGAPFAHPSALAQYRVFEEMNRHGYRVSLGGQGADEAFMGYRKFQFFYLRELIRHGDWWRVPGVALGILAMLKADGADLRNLLLYRNRYRKAADTYTPFQQVKSTAFDLNYGSYSDLAERQIADVGFASLLTLLRYEDRNSMGHSVESRMPYLDYRVMELGVALPNHLKIRNGYGKWILRRLADNRLPENIVKNRSKKAFALDADRWMDVALGSYMRATIEPRLSSLQEVFSPDAMSLLKSSASYREARHFPLLVSAYWLSQRL